MPIPPAEPAHGNLPPGIHEAEWAEFVARFGTNPRRQRLIEGLRRALEALRTARCRRVYIDGSFITTKELPGDFDGCWETAGVDLDLIEALAPPQLDIRAPRQVQKQAYGGELFPADYPADWQGRPFLTVFQRDRDGTPKGIVVLNLEALVE